MGQYNNKKHLLIEKTICVNFNSSDNDSSKLKVHELSLGMDHLLKISKFEYV
jgi:hypothetical protein